MAKDVPFREKVTSLLGDKFSDERKAIFASDLEEEIYYAQVDGKDKDRLLECQKSLMRDAARVEKSIKRLLNNQVKIRSNFKSITPLVPFCVETRDDSPIQQSLEYILKYQFELKKLKLSKPGPKNNSAANTAHLVATLYYQHLGQYPSAAKEDSGRFSRRPYDRVCDYIEERTGIEISEPTRIQAVKNIKKGG